MTNFIPQDRTVGDIIGLSIIIIVGVVAFLFLLFKLRNTKDAYGIKSQIIGICFTWIIIAIITSLSGLKSPIMKGIWKVFSPGSLLLPFFFGTMVPLYKTYKTLIFKGSPSTSGTQSTIEDFATNASGNSTEGSSHRRARVRNLSELKNKMNFYSLIHYVNADRKAVGFDSIYSFCIQLDISSGHKDYYYRNALLFVREYDLKKKELENETVEKQTKQFTNVLILYQKYMADGTAEIDHGRTALSTVLVEEELLKKLQTTLNEAVKKDDYKSEGPIETIHLIYENTMKETITYMYKSYVLSNYFEAFMKQFNADQRLKTLAIESV